MFLFLLTMFCLSLSISNDIWDVVRDVIRECEAASEHLEHWKYNFEIIKAGSALLEGWKPLI